MKFHDNLDGLIYEVNITSEKSIKDNEDDF